MKLRYVFRLVFHLMPSYSPNSGGIEFFTYFTFFTCKYVKNNFLRNLLTSARNFAKSTTQVKIITTDMTLLQEFLTKKSIN